MQGVRRDDGVASKLLIIAILMIAMMFLDYLHFFDSANAFKA